MESSPPAAGPPPPAQTSDQLRQIEKLEWSLWYRLSNLENDIFNIENEYLATFSVGNVVVGWDTFIENRVPDRRKGSDGIFSGSSATWEVQHAKQEGRLQAEAYTQQSSSQHGGMVKKPKPAGHGAGGAVPQAVRKSVGPPGGGGGISTAGKPVKAAALSTSKKRSREEMMMDGGGEDGQQQQPLEGSSAPADPTTSYAHPGDPAGSVSGGEYHQPAHTGGYVYHANTGAAEGGPSPSLSADFGGGGGGGDGMAGGDLQDGVPAAKRVAMKGRR